MPSHLPPELSESQARRASALRSVPGPLVAFSDDARVVEVMLSADGVVRSWRRPWARPSRATHSGGPSVTTAPSLRRAAFLSAQASPVLPVRADLASSTAGAIVWLYLARGSGPALELGPLQ